MEKTIICIGREYGSGGHAIGKILAKRTGYEFYDKERFITIAKERGFEGEVEEYLEEQPMNSLLFRIHFRIICWQHRYIHDQPIIMVGKFPISYCPDTKPKLKNGSCSNH